MAKRVQILLSRWLPYAVFLLALVVFFVSQRQEEKASHTPRRKTVTFWGFSYPAQTMRELKAGFEALHPEVEVEVQTVAWEHLQQKTLWAIAANSNVPDIIVASSEWLGGLVAAGALAPLDEDFEPEFFDRYFSNALKIYQYNEMKEENSLAHTRVRQYGVPLDLDLMLVFYRADILEPFFPKVGLTQFPETWEELVALGRQVHEEFQTSTPPVKLMVLDPEDPVPLSMAFFPAAGAQILDGQLKHPRFNSPEGCAAFAFFYRLLKENCAVRWDRGTMEDPLILFKTNRALVQVSGPWYGKVLERRAPELAGRWRVAKFPRRQPNLPSSALGGACLAIPYNAPHRKEACELIRFIATDEFALAYFKRVGSPPPLRTAWEKPEFSQPVAYFGGQRIYDVIRDAIETAQPSQLLPNTEISRVYLRRALRTICAGAAIQPTLEQAAQQVELLLSQ